MPKAKPKFKPKSKKSSTPKRPTSAAKQTNFQRIFESLKKILHHHAGNLFIKKDEPRNYYAETVSHSWKGQRMFFGAATINKNYVSFLLMPVYVAPELLQTISPALKRRMQGKSCFNFTATPAPELLAELATLTAAGLEKYKSRKFA